MTHVKQQRARQTSPQLSGVLLAVCCALAVAGCSSSKQTPAERNAEAFADVQAEVRATVADPDRATRAVELIDQLMTEFEDAAERLNAGKERIRLLNADYDAPREAFDAGFAAYRAVLVTNQDNVIALRTQLVQQFTDEEWAAIDKARSKALTAAIKSLQDI